MNEQKDYFEKCAALITAHLNNDAQVSVKDMTGTGDHLSFVIASQRFKGLLPLARHRLVMDALSEELKGALHAVKLKTLTPDQLENRPLEEFHDFI
jgi:stress-induced morphogen